MGGARSWAGQVAGAGLGGVGGGARHLAREGDGGRPSWGRSDSGSERVSPRPRSPASAAALRNVWSGPLSAG